MTIGQRIAELRKKNNLSQEALGEELGVSRQSVSKWESDTALPEIDKLIAMSKRFGVTVGFLLGVEEETARQAEAADEEKGPTEAEVLERYLNSLPKKKPLTGGKKFLLVVAAVIAVFCAVDYISNLESRLSQVNYQVTNLSHQVSNVQSNLYGISDDISTKIDEALKQEYGLLASWNMKLVELDYKEGTATVQLNAVLKHRNENGGGLGFFAQLSDGSYIMAGEDSGTFNSVTNSYTAQLVLPMTESDLVYYLTTPEGIVCLAEDGSHDLCYLRDGTQIQVMFCDMFYTADAQGVRGEAELYFAPPWMATEQMGGILSEPQVKMWLVYNGERMATLEPENAYPYDYALDRNYNCRFRVESDKIPNLQEGDRIWLEYEISYGEGLAATGRGESGFVYQGGNWMPMDEDTIVNTVTIG